jgi:Family of unknown function (DUF6152)
MRLRDMPCAVALILAAVAGASAHHSFAALFDVSKTITLTGEVTQTEFKAPHAYIHLQATDTAGESAAWQIETTTPGMLIRKGITPDTLAPGQKISVIGNPTRDGRKIMRLLTITMPDGQEVELQ